jgi:hypothetical protein
MREHGHLVASRLGRARGRLESRKRAAPAGGAKRETARIAVDRSPDRPLGDPSRYIGRNLHSRRSTRNHLINAKHRIMDGGNGIRDCASFPCHRCALGRILRPQPGVLRRPVGWVRHLYWLNPEPQHEWDIDLILSAYAPNSDQVLEGRNLRQLVACVDEIATR